VSLTWLPLALLGAYLVGLVVGIVIERPASEGAATEEKQQ